MFKKTLLATTAVLFATSPFAADVDNTNLDIAFQGAHFQGAGNQITMLRVPVTNKDTGETQLFDMSAVFAADKNGNLIFKDISSVKSLAFASANNLVAGHYLDTKNCSWFIEGPSVTANGRMSWSLIRPVDNVGCSQYEKARSGQVLSGPLEGNQLAINQKKIYKNLIKNPESNLNYGSYSSSYILAAVQNGNSISLSLYHENGMYDSWAIIKAPYPGKKED